jgi:phospholipid/cholesterol/gamma-HCH transport system substrate-binding protein
MMEVRVGAFVLLGLVLLVYIVFSVSDIFRTDSSHQLNVVFRSVGGVDVGAPVRLAGVGVGEIKKIDIFYEPSEKTALVRLETGLKKGTIIKEGYKAYIRTLGLLGEKYLEIMPGIEAEGKRVLASGEVLRGEDPVSLEEAMEGISELTQDKDVKESLRQALITSAELLKKLNRLTENVDLMVTQNSDNIHQLVVNLKDATEDLDVTVTSLNNIFTKVEKGEGTIGKLINETDIYDNLSALAADLRKHPGKLLQRVRTSDTPTRGTEIKPSQHKKDMDSGHGIP